MDPIDFPPVTRANRNGLLLVGGGLTASNVTAAYRRGIFPWPSGEGDVAWYAPPHRAIIPLPLHVPKSLRKSARKREFEVVVDRDFETVMNKAAEVVNRGDQGGTWITSDIVAAYTDLHYQGIAHSVECYEAGELTGGLYGVCIGGMFAAESAFYRRPDASKFCLWKLGDYLASEGLPWIDVQQLTPLSYGFGGGLVQRRLFQKLLEAALEGPSPVFRKGQVL